MRNLETVLTRCLSLVPAEEVALQHSLSSVRDSAKYASPEAQAYQWQRAATVLQEQVGVPQNDWQQAIQNEFVHGKE